MHVHVHACTCMCMHMHMHMCMCMYAQVGLLRYLYQAHTLDAQQQHSTMLHKRAVLCASAVGQTVYSVTYFRGVSARRTSCRVVARRTSTCVSLGRRGKNDPSGPSNRWPGHVASHSMDAAAQTEVAREASSAVHRATAAPPVAAAVWWKTLLLIVWQPSNPLDAPGMTAAASTPCSCTWSPMARRRTSDASVRR